MVEFTSKKYIFLYENNVFQLDGRSTIHGNQVKVVEDYRFFFYSMRG